MSKTREAEDIRAQTFLVRLTMMAVEVVAYTLMTAAVVVSVPFWGPLWVYGRVTKKPMKYIHHDMQVAGNAKPFSVTVDVRQLGVVRDGVSFSTRDGYIFIGYTSLLRWAWLATCWRVLQRLQRLRSLVKVKRKEKKKIHEDVLQLHPSVPGTAKRRLPLA